MSRPHFRNPLTVLAVALGVACARRGGSASTTTSTMSTVSGDRAMAPPVLDSLVPARVELRRGAVAEVTLFGSNFDSLATVVLIDDVVVTSRPSPTRRSLTFAMPVTLRVSAEAAPMRVTPGAHQVRVRTSTGVSNPRALDVN